MDFRSLQCLRFFTALLTMMLIARATNAQTNETGQGCNCEGSRPAVEFKPFSDGLSSNSSAGNNKDCNTISVIINNAKIPVDNYAQPLTHCVSSQSQPVNNP